MVYKIDASNAAHRFKGSSFEIDIKNESGEVATVTIKPTDEGVWIHLDSWEFESQTHLMEIEEI